MDIENLKGVFDLPIINMITLKPEYKMVNVIYIAEKSDTPVIIIEDNDHIQDYYYNNKLNGYIALTTTGFEMNSWEDTDFIHEPTPDFMIGKQVDGYVYNKISSGMY